MADLTGMPDGMGTLPAMGWERLPYGCIGLARKTNVDRDRIAWSWLILIPWAENDAKPWVDGTELMSLSLTPAAEQRERVLGRMREILDKRYGDSVAGRAADRIVDGLE